MIHRGEIVEKAIRDSGINITLLAKKLGKSRRHLYNLFQYHNLDFETIAQIGAIIRHDFSGVFPEMRIELLEMENVNSEVDVERCINLVNYWKDKYILLLEEYNKLLKDQTNRTF